MTYTKKLEELIDEYTTIDTSSIIGPYPSMNVGIGATGSNGSVYTSNGTGNAMWTTSPYQTISNWNTIGTTQPSVQIKGDAEFEGKVMINKRDLGEFMEAMSKRLAILVPDPAKLEHFEALKKAYNHYKTLEALCELPKETKE
jgi:hypothetical protein